MEETSKCYRGQSATGVKILPGFEVVWVGGRVRRFAQQCGEASSKTSPLPALLPDI